VFRPIAPTDVRIREALVRKQQEQERFYAFIS
jgi:hypothetical protein